MKGTAPPSKSSSKGCESSPLNQQSLLSLIHCCPASTHPHSPSRTSWSRIQSCSSSNFVPLSIPGPLVPSLLEFRLRICYMCLIITLQPHACKKAPAVSRRMDGGCSINCCSATLRAQDPSTASTRRGWGRDRNSHAD